MQIFIFIRLGRLIRLSINRAITNLRPHSTYGSFVRFVRRTKRTTKSSFVRNAHFIFHLFVLTQRTKYFNNSIAQSA